MGPRFERASPSRAVPLLEDVDELPEGTSGSLIFSRARGPLGVILVQDRNICWATASGMRGRLTDILIGESGGDLDRAEVEAVYARCRRHGIPLGEALVEAGVVSSSGLRCALLRHIAEALCTMSLHGRQTPRWDAHARGTYDARFTFSSAEIYTFLCASFHERAAVEAETALRQVLCEGCVGIAFVRDDGGLPVALRGELALGVRELAQLGGWVASSYDIADALNRNPALVVFNAGLDGAALWRHDTAICLALCKDPSELTYVIATRSKDRRVKGRIGAGLRS